MATIQTQAIFEWKGRPCIVIGETMQTQFIQGKRRSWLAVQLRFIDGLEPVAGLVGKKTWGHQGKVIKGAQALVWQRVRQLADQGLAADVARRQALAEFNKGVLAAGMF